MEEEREGGFVSRASSAATAGSSSWETRRVTFTFWSAAASTPLRALLPREAGRSLAKSVNRSPQVLAGELCEWIVEPNAPPGEPSPPTVQRRQAGRSLETPQRIRNGSFALTLTSICI